MEILRSHAEFGDGDYLMLVHALNPLPLKDSAIRLALLSEMKSIGGDIRRDFQKTTATWKHKPKFEIMTSLVGGTSVAIVTNDEIYSYVNFGTKPHDIWAGTYTGKSDKKVLKFPGTFSAKTIPGVIYSLPGYSGGPPVYTPYVRHPGTKPRNFEEAIYTEWEKTFVNRMNNALLRGAKESGDDP